MNADVRDSRDDVLEYLRAHLPAERQSAACMAYERAAKDGTAAFLTCYFLGLFGAHRMYLGDWTGAAIRLLIPLGLAFVAIVGILGLIPSLAALLLAGILLLVGLAWEALDLTRIDGEVTRANRELANHLVAASMGGGMNAMGGGMNAMARTPGVSTPNAAGTLRAADAGPAGREPVPSYPRQAWQAPEALVAEPMPELAPVPAWPQEPEWNAGAPTGMPNGGVSGAGAPAEPTRVPAQDMLPPRPVDRPGGNTLDGPAGFSQAAHAQPGDTETTAPLPAISPRSTQPLSYAGRPTGTAAEPPPPATAEPPASIAPPADVAADPGYSVPSFAARVAPPNANRAAPFLGPADESSAPVPVPAGNAQETPAVTSAAPLPPEAAPGGEPERAAGSASRPMKRIRVKRRIVVDGQVVGEQVIEELVPADMDTQVAAAALRARLAEMTSEQIAALANLPPGAPIELRNSATLNG